MSVQGNPYVINDSSLIMYYDFGNIKSWLNRATTPTSNDPLYNLARNGKGDGFLYIGGRVNGFSNSNLGYLSLATNTQPQNSIQIPNPTALSTTTYTKCAWFRISTSVPSNGYGHPAISSNILGGGIGSNHFFGTWIYNSYTYFGAGNNNIAGANVGVAPLYYNIWYFGAAAFSSSTGWTLYVDGNPATVFNNNTNSFTNSYLWYMIGTWGYQSSNPPISWDYTQYLYGFYGDIAMAMAYNRILSRDEIRQIYDATKSRFV